MAKTEPQFEPEKQIGNAISDLDKTLRAAGDVIARLSRLRETLAEEVKQLKDERDSLKVYTEEEAAMLLRLDTENAARAKKHLAELRKTLNLPHLNCGNKPRYTQGHLVRICSILEVNTKQNLAHRRAA